MYFEPIGISSFIALAVMAIVGLIVPIVIGIIWCKKTKERFVKLIVGALMFFVFAVILESIPKAVLLNPSNSIGNLVLSTPILFVLIGGLLAGLFEEIGRFVGFKFLLKKDLDNKKTAISYGIGHAGFEIAYVFSLSAIQYAVYAVMINSGTFHEIIEQLPSQSETFINLAKAIHDMTFLSLGPALFERMSALMIHISCSILVYKSIRGKKYCFPFAILMHAAFDWIAGATQVGWITNIFVVEAMLFVFGSVFFYFAIKSYKRIQ